MFLFLLFKSFASLLTLFCIATEVEIEETSSQDELVSPNSAKANRDPVKGIYIYHLCTLCQGNTYLRTRLHPTDREEGGDRKDDRARER